MSANIFWEYHAPLCEKKLTARCDEDSINYYLAFQELWATPINSNWQSPAELLFSRQLKTTLPAIISPPHNSEAVRPSLKVRQDYSRYDAHSMEKPDLLPTQPIWVQDTISKQWNPGVVKSQAETPHSFIIQTPQGEYREKPFASERGSNTNTSPKSVSTTYNTKVSLQPMQRNVCIMSPSLIKESSNNNKGNSNVSAQCVPTPQNIPTVEMAEIKEPRRSSRITKQFEHYIRVANINTNLWYNKLIGYLKPTKIHKHSDQFIV